MLNALHWIHPVLAAAILTGAILVCLFAVAIYLGTNCADCGRPQFTASAVYATNTWVQQQIEGTFAARTANASPRATPTASGQ